MRRVLVAMAACATLTALTTAMIDTSNGETAGARATAALPSSLDDLYPPHARGPVWLVTMIQLGTSFSGFVSDVLEGDFENADRGYAEFRAQYGKLAELVPEWEGLLPIEPMDALGQALQTRDPAAVMPAVDRASGVCHTCHVQNMTLVQQKFHWGDFQRIDLTDPVSGTDVTFPILMRMLDGDLSGIGVDLAEGQPERAREHVAGLAERFVTLEEACGACHDTERHYYVDASIDGLIEQLGTELARPEIDAASVQGLVQGIGMESCHKCHLVHGPAALAAYVQGAGAH